MSSDPRADTVSAIATGTGVGFAALVVVWFAASRPALALLDRPTGPIAALAAAIVTGIVVAIVASRRCLAAQSSVGARSSAATSELEVGSNES